jgi:hypothetical protein
LDGVLRRAAVGEGCRVRLEMGVGGGGGLVVGVSGWWWE